MKTFAECREKLDLLLEEGRTASNEDSNPKRKSVCKKLLKFVDDTDSAIDGTADLDDLAIETHDVLSLEWVDSSVGEIERRNAELRAIAKQVERVSAEVEKSSAVNRLTKATAAIDALQDVSDALRDLDDVLKDGDDDELRAKLTDALKAVEGLKKLVEKNKEG
jgi:hypothetical protein